MSDRPCLVCNSGRQRCSESHECCECSVEGELESVVVKPLDIKPIQERHEQIQRILGKHGIANQAHQDRKALLTEIVRLRGELDKLNAELEEWENQ